MNPCKNCGQLPKHCTCRQQTTQATKAPCQKCGDIHLVKYLKDRGGLELCSTCTTIESWKPDDREYYRAIANEYRFPLIDIPTHLQAANGKGETLEEYLPTLPRSRDQFRAYFDGKPITIGGVTL